MGKTLRLTPGFRFHPTDVELVKYYLKRKILGRKFYFDAIAEVDIYKHAPWELPDKSSLKSRDLKWYFFCPREKKYACGIRINRATEFGYWKTTGKDRPVIYDGETVGMIKTLVFHRGRAPKGDRTDWVMHEYKLKDKDLIDVQDSYVLCMIFQKEGPGPRNGAQYGAPFNEEEWTDNEEEICAETGASSKISDPNLLLPIARTSLGSFSESCISGAGTPSLGTLRPVSSYDVGLNNTVASTSHALTCTGVGPSSESCVSDVVAPGGGQRGSFELNENQNNKVVTNNIEQRPAVNGAPSPDETDVFEGLVDFCNLAGLGNDGIGLSNAHTLEKMFYGGDFLELRDLARPLPPNISGDCSEDEVQCNQLSAGFNCYPDSSKSGHQADMAQPFPRANGGGGLEEYWFSACSTATQVNAVNLVRSSLPPPGGAFGFDNYDLNSCSGAPNN